MESTDRFDVKYLDDAWNFIASLDDKSRRKMLANIEIARKCNNPKFFKKLEGSEIWEFRTQFAKMQYRLLAFWDNRKQSFVIATHGFIKKTQKTPPHEIAKAEQIRQEYFENKEEQL